MLRSNLDLPIIRSLIFYTTYGHIYELMDLLDLIYVSSTLEDFMLMSVLVDVNV